MRIGLIIGLLTGVMALFACGNNAMSSGSGGGPGAGAPTFDATGKWQITTKSQSGATGGAVATIQRNSDGSLSGGLSDIEPPCATSATLTVIVNNNKIQMTADENGQGVSFTGAATATGALSGTYTSPTGGCTNGDTGTWTATRTGSK
jgi:hypothetical protein